VCAQHNILIQSRIATATCGVIACLPQGQAAREEEDRSRPGAMCFPDGTCFDGETVAAEKQRANALYRVRMCALVVASHTQERYASPFTLLHSERLVFSS
jgi:hypothetical protein